MDRLSAVLDNYKGSALGLLRILSALIIFQAGYTKVFVWGLSATAGNFQKMGVILPQLTGPFIGVLELVGGALLTIGLFTRYLGLIFAANFAVASYVVAVGMGKGAEGPTRLPALLAIVMLVLATNGGGALNLGTILKKGA